MADITFHAWNRPELAGADDAPPGGARRRLDLTLNASLEPTDGTTISVDGTTQIELAGPGDVAGLAPAAIVRVSPPNGSNAEGEFCAYVDLVAADLPWRYTPMKPDAEGGLQPWLAVVAGAEGREIGLDARGDAWISKSLAQQLDPTRAGCWGHVHYQNGPPRLVQAARVLCPRKLPDNEACLAVVVPLFKADGKTRWTGSQAVTGLPVLHSWRFRTNEAGSFLDLAAKLVAAHPPAGLGIGWVDAELTSGQTAHAATFGLLAPIGLDDAGPWSDPTLPSQVAERLLPSPAAGEQPVVGPPRYGVTWVGDLESTPWGATLCHDPRHRAIAGLGTRAGVDWQQQITDAAARRLGQTHLAAAMLADLCTGVTLMTRLQRRQPGGDGPATGSATAERLAFYGPALRKVRAPGQHTVLGALTGSPSPLIPAALSAAALRLLRPGGSIGRLTQHGSATPGQVIHALNRCQSPPEPTLPKAQQELPKDPGSIHEHLLNLAAGLDRADDVGEPFAPNRSTIPDLYDWLGPEDERPVCEEVDLDAAVGALDVAFDPHGVPVEAVLGRITPRPQRFDVPYVVEPDLDLPAWAWLRDHAPEWILPAAGLIPADSIVALRTDGRFLESFLVGLSEQAVAELRWRGVPMAPKAMPMRTLWQRLRHPEDKVRPDLANAADWSPTSALGDPAHRCGDQDMLVIVLRSELLRRYPGTVIRLAPRVSPDPLDPPDPTRPAEPDLDAPGLPPAAIGRISDELWFLAFDIPPSELGSQFLILEETVDGPRFRPPDGPLDGPLGYRVTSVMPDGEGQIHSTPRTATDGAAYALHAWAAPVRVAIDGQALVYPAPGIGLPAEPGSTIGSPP